MIKMLKTWYKKEREKTSKMTKKEKISYIFTYYKGVILVLALILIFLLYLPYHYIYDNAKSAFNCTIINYAIDDARDLRLAEKFDEYLDLNPREEYTYFDGSYNVPYGETFPEGADWSFNQKFFLNIKVGLMDAAFIPEDFFQYCNSLGQIFYDLPDILSEEQLEFWEERFEMGKDEQGKEYLAGINVTDMTFLEEEQFIPTESYKDDKLILTFPYGDDEKNETKKERMRAFLDFILSYE